MKHGVKAFLLILWSGGISYVRHSFHPRHAKTAYPGTPVLAEWRVGFSFLVYTISKNALAVYEATLQGDGDGVCAVIRAEFGKDTFHMTFDGGLGKVELGRDDLVGVSHCDSAQHSNLPLAERILDHVVGEPGSDFGRNAPPASVDGSNRIQQLLPQHVL
jgi:hypothetical protein